ncbi:hypothetical protein [Thioalkalivibrio sp. ALE12]|uniref:hypothetical protein n=1 Tax=Thioalkalivibrio sp. ALE12 TaxID=1158170 RepID=UPI0012DCC47A|nr:hypothetical protein [Thioalkalivibrio sp. ALE12]
MRAGVGLVLAAGVSSLLLVGCATSKVWHHPGKSSQQFHGDSAQCQAIAGQAGAANPQIQPVPGSGAMAGGFAQGWNQASAVGAAGAQQSAFRSCMIGQGWRLVDEDSIPSPVATSQPTSSDDQEVLDAIDANPPLRDWMENDPARWNLAVDIDTRMMDNPDFDHLSVEERFSMVVEAVENLVEEHGEPLLNSYRHPQ